MLLSLGGVMANAEVIKQMLRFHKKRTYNVRTISIFDKNQKHEKNTVYINGYCHVNIL